MRLSRILTFATIFFVIVRAQLLVLAVEIAYRCARSHCTHTSKVITVNNAIPRRVFPLPGPSSRVASQQQTQPQPAPLQGLIQTTGGSAIPQGPPLGPVQIIFRGLTSSTPGQAAVTGSWLGIRCSPNCIYYFLTDETVTFYAKDEKRLFLRDL